MLFTPTVPAKRCCLCWLISSSITQICVWWLVHYVYFKIQYNSPWGSLQCGPWGTCYALHWSFPSGWNSPGSSLDNWAYSDKWIHFAAINGSACFDISVFDRNLFKGTHRRSSKIILLESKSGPRKRDNVINCSTQDLTHWTQLVSSGVANTRLYGEYTQMGGFMDFIH